MAVSGLETMNIACWSGPRNLSTAMMYAFAARGDCAVWDEPFYAAFLKATDADHPMKSETISAGLTDPLEVASACLDTNPAGKPYFYQKHMSHHMLDDFPLEWAMDLTNVILIRHPFRVVASYAAKRENPVASDLGARKLREIHGFLQSSGREIPILDSADTRKNPGGMLEALCDHINLPWTSDMLRWNSGGNPEDGPWAAHWYGAIHASTGFAGPEPPLPDLGGSLADIAASMMDDYEALADLRLTV